MNKEQQAIEPVGRRPVIDHLICPQNLEPLRLLVARRGGNDTHTKEFGELKGIDLAQMSKIGEVCSD